MSGRIIPESQRTQRREAGAYLRHEREARKISRFRLAVLVGVTSSGILQAEAGLTTESTIERIANALGVPVPQPTPHAEKEDPTSAA
jgi:transcriptional regulator with XRE-family HTH domain